ncbi:MAG: PQQ-binding-like beta-propeller repeat protein, partial [Candidatus Micrarchaeota archaeon]|nr:PQQ-binding-like beta-propeller repeat protein [Candidatus Micrarchaeota archaeon]
MRMRPFLPVLALALILFISAAHAGLKWPVFHTGAPVVGAPVVGGNVVYALTDDGIIYSLDYVTGGQSLPFNLGGPASVEPVSDGQNLYVGTDDGQVQAIDMARTQRLWRYPAQPTNRTLAPLAGLAIGPGLVYVVTKNQTIALNASTGA